MVNHKVVAHYGHDICAYEIISVKYGGSMKFNEFHSYEIFVRTKKHSILNLFHGWRKEQADNIHKMSMRYQLIRELLHLIWKSLL